jgi:hypothetical protein
VLGEASSRVCGVGRHGAFDGGEGHEGEEGEVAGYVCVGGAEEELWEGVLVVLSLWFGLGMFQTYAIEIKR